MVMHSFSIIYREKECITITFFIDLTRFNLLKNRHGTLGINLTKMTA